MSYKKLWQSIFPDHYQDKYQHETGLSGGGGEYATYDIHLKEKILLGTQEKKFALGSSIEYFNTPKDWMLLTKNKSSIARKGIDASFSTFIDPGFKGFLTIEIVNFSGNAIMLKTGQPILKVVAIPCIFPVYPYTGKYQNQPNKPVSAITDTGRVKKETKKRQHFSELICDDWSL